MKERTTQLLLAAIAVLLAAQFLRPAAERQAEAGDGPDVPAVLRARTIELVDDRGQVRASLKVAPEGEAVFRLMDARGTIRFKAGAAEDGTGLLLLDDRTEPAIHLLAKREGTTLSLTEKGKDKRVIRP